MCITNEKSQIALRPPKSTAIYLLLGSDIIANAQVRYRSALLYSVLGAIEIRLETNGAFHPTVRMQNTV